MEMLSLTSRAHTGDRMSPRPVPQAPRRLSRAELVAQVDDFLRDNINDPVTVGDLSRMVGVSERTLRSAFHDVLGISPKQWALRQRLGGGPAGTAPAPPGAARAQA